MLVDAEALRQQREHLLQEPHVIDIGVGAHADGAVPEPEVPKLRVGGGSAGVVGARVAVGLAFLTSTMVQVRGPALLGHTWSATITHTARTVRLNASPPGLSAWGYTMMAARRNL